MSTMSRLLGALRDKDVVLSLDETGQRIRYRAPKGALTDDDKVALRARREEILRFLHARAAANRPPLRPGRDAVPSFTQEFLWRAARASPTQNSERRIVLCLPFRNCPAAAVQAAIKALVARHEALRYSFTESAGILRAHLNDPDEFQVGLEASSPPEIAEYIAGVPSLEGKWLTRARVFLGPDADGLIVLVLHHIIGDGTSLVILADELSILLAHGQRDLPPCALQFSDFAAWEREHLRGETAERLAAYWGNWSKAVPLLQHPDTRVTLEWMHGDRVDYDLVVPAAVACEFDRLARQLRVTPFMLLLAVFCIALSRWSGQARYAILSVADGRAFPDTLALRRTVGLILHMDPIEVNLSGGLELRDVLRMLQANYAAARELRFPLNESLPGLRVHEIIHKIGATLNYRDLRADDPERASPSAAPPAHTPAELRLRRPEPVAGERYDVPFQPINLRIEQHDAFLSGKVEFNDAVIRRAEQRAIVDHVLGVFEEVLLAKSMP